MKPEDRKAFEEIYGTPEQAADQDLWYVRYDMYCLGLAHARKQQEEIMHIWIDTYYRTNKQLQKGINRKNRLIKRLRAQLAQSVPLTPEGVQDLADTLEALEASKQQEAPEGSRDGYDSFVVWWMDFKQTLPPGSDFELAHDVAYDTWHAAMKQREAQRERVCRWKPGRFEHATHSTGCGVDYMIQKSNVPNYCPNCGGKVQEGEG